MIEGFYLVDLSPDEFPVITDRGYGIGLTLKDEAGKNYTVPLEAGEAEERLRAMLPLFEEIDAWESMTSILKQLAKCVYEQKESLSFHRRVGEIEEEHLGDLQESFSSYQAVLALLPEDEEALSALKRLFDKGLRDPDLISLLQDGYESKEEWEALIGLYVALLPFAKSPKQRVEMLSLVASISEEHTQDLERSLEVSGMILVLQPDNAEVLQRVLRLAKETSAWEIAAESLEEAEEQVEDPILARRLLSNAASFYEEHLNDWVRAANCYEKILALFPEELEVFDALDRLYLALKSWSPLARILEAKAPLIRIRAVQIETLTRLANTLEDRLDNDSEALSIHREILSRSNTHLTSLKSLTRLLERFEDWEALIDILQRRATLALEPDDEVERTLHAASVMTKHLDDPQRAANTLLQLLARNPNHLGTLRESAIALQRLERWIELTNILERTAELLQGPNDKEERLRVSKRVATLWGEKLNDHRQAFQWWSRALELSTRDLEVLNALYKIHQEAGRTQELEEILGFLVLITPDDAERLLLLEEQVALLVNFLAQPHDAAKIWRKILLIDPEHLRALLALDEHYREHHLWRELIQLLEHRLQFVAEEDLEGQVELFLEMGAVARDSLEDFDQAIESFLMVLELEPLSERAFEALDGIFGEEKRWVELIDLYETRALLTEDLTVRAAFLIRVAETHEEKLSNPDRAFELLLEILPWGHNQPKLTAALTERFGKARHYKAFCDVLTEMYKFQGPWAEVMRSVQEHAKEHLSSEKLTSLRAALAIMVEEGFKAPKDAIPMWVSVLDSEPHHLEGLRRLVLLLKTFKRWKPLTMVLDGLVKALSMNKKPSNSEGVKEEVIKALRLLAKVEKGYLKKPADAAKSWERLCELVPTDPEALDELITFYVQSVLQSTQEAHLLARALRDRIPTVSTLRKQSLQIQLAKLLEERLDDPNESMKLWGALLSVTPKLDPALKALTRHYKRTKSWRSLLDILERRADLAPEGKKNAFLSSAARIYEGPLGDAAAATRRWKDLLARAPLHKEAYQHLQVIFSKGEQWESLIELHEDKLGRSKEPKEINQAAMFAAEVFDHNEDSDQAFAVLIKGFIKNTEASGKLVESLVQRCGRDLERWTILCGALLKQSTRFSAKALDTQDFLVKEWTRPLMKEAQRLGVEGKGFFELALSINGKYRKKKVQILKRALQVIPQHPEWTQELIHEMRHTRQWSELGALLLQRSENPEIKRPKQILALQEALDIYQFQIRDPAQSLTIEARLKQKKRGAGVIVGVIIGVVLMLLPLIELFF